MASVEKSKKSGRDAKKGIDGKREEGRPAVIGDMRNAEKTAGRGRPPRRGDVLKGIVKGAVKGCAGALKKIIKKPKGSELEVPFRRAGNKRQAVHPQPSGHAIPFTSPSLGGCDQRSYARTEAFYSTRRIASGQPWSSALTTQPRMCLWAPN